LVELYTEVDGARTQRDVWSGSENSFACWACYISLSAVITAAIIGAGIAVGGLIIGTDGLAAPAVVEAIVAATNAALSAPVVTALVGGAGAGVGLAVPLAVGAAVGAICHAIPNCCSSKTFVGDDNWTVGPLAPGAHKSDCPPALAVLNDVLYCVHKGQRNDNHLWCTTLDQIGGNWTADVLMRSGDPNSGPTFDTVHGPALTSFRNQLVCIYSNADKGGALYLTTCQDGIHWEAPTQLPGPCVAASEPAASVYNTDWLYYVYRDQDGDLFYANAHESLSFSSPAPLKNCQSQSGVGLLEYAERLWCVYRGQTDDSLSYITLEGAWLDPKPFGGDHRTTAKPALVNYRGSLMALYFGSHLMYFATFDEPSQTWTAAMPAKGGGLETGPGAVEINMRLLAAYPTVMPGDFMVTALKNLPGV
jgi:hypothetical protein